MYDKNVRIDDIAKMAGVSRSTVSRVINHPDLVREETREMIMNAISTLGIESSIRKTIKQKSRKSKRGQNSIVIFNIPIYGNTFFTEIFKGAEASALAHGISLLTYTGFINSFTLPTFISIIETTNAIGVISLCQLENDILTTLNELLPLVICCEYNEEVPSSYVGVDDRKAAENAVEYIVSTGHRKIAMINCASRHRFSRHRYEGFRAAIEKANINIPSNWIINLTNIDYDAAVAAVTHILSSENPPNAVFAVADILAVATLNVARNLGFKIPEDIVIVGFDDTETARVSSPPLTSVSLPCYQIGYTASEMLFEKISNPSEPVRSILFNTSLIVRESSSSSNSFN